MQRSNEQLPARFIVFGPVYGLVKFAARRRLRLLSNIAGAAAETLGKQSPASLGIADHARRSMPARRHAEWFDAVPAERATAVGCAARAALPIGRELLPDDFRTLNVPFGFSAD
jgi:hypothetical protein